MLVLSRKDNESIVINGNITIVVVGIQSGRVRLGIDAPQDVPVHRQEVAIRMNRDANQEAVLKPTTACNCAPKFETSV